MTKRTWFITGVSSGFGKELSKQLLAKGDRVIGTVRNSSNIQDLIDDYPSTFLWKQLDLTDFTFIYRVVDEVFAQVGNVDVVVSNAGYGLFGTAEEVSQLEIEHIIATNLTGSIAFIKAVLPHLRKLGGGRILQVSSYGGQVAYPSNSLYHATKFGIEGFCEAVAQEVAPYHIGITIVEPGGARTQFRYGSAKVATLMPEYEHCHNFLSMLDPKNGLAPGDPTKMAQRMIESVEIEPAPMRMILGSLALQATLERLKGRIADYETQVELAASTDFIESSKNP